MFRFKNIATLTSILAVTLFVSPLAAANNLKVVSTFSIISDFAENIGGDRIALTTLVGPNNDAHTYEPRPSDVAAVKNADVVLANGAGFEGFFERLIQASGSTATVIELTKGIELLRNPHDDDHHHIDHQHHDDHGHENPGGHDHDQHTDHHHEAHSHAEGHHHHGEYDPHAWQSVPNAQVYVSNIAKAFCDADQEGCSTYQSNAEAYDAKLIALDKDLKALVHEIPTDRRTVITSHDAFAYLGDEYGFKFLAPQGVSTGSEASAQTVAKLIQQIKQQEASALFLENISNPQLIQQIANETGMKIGGKLYSDALSTEDGDAATYIDMMRHNIGTIRNATLGK